MTAESLTVEETNVLRAQLGLPPLTNPTPPLPLRPPSSPTPSPAADDPASSLTNLRTELLRRQQARATSALLSTPSLSSQLTFSTSASDWVRRHRTVAPAEAARQAERARVEAERRRQERVEYDASHLAGLRIVHDYDAFEDGGAVLVLKDKKIGEEGNEEDELVNAELDAKERQRAGKGAKPGKGQEADDERPSLLAKYDEEEDQREGIVLGGGGAYSREEQEKRRWEREEDERRERLQQGWEGAPGARVEYDVSGVERRVDSDYAPVTFKKKKDRAKREGEEKGELKSRRGRKERGKVEDNGGEDWIAQLEEEAKKGAVDGGSKGEQEKSRREEEERKEKKTLGYLRALEKGEEATRQRVERDKREEEEQRQKALQQQPNPRDMEEEDEELALAVQRARRLAQREKQTAVVRVKVEGSDDAREVRMEPVSGVKALAERIVSERAEAAVKREGVKLEGRERSEGDMREDEEDDEGIVFTSVSNFAAGLNAPEDNGRGRGNRGEEGEREVKREQTAQSAMKVEPTAAEGKQNGSHSANASNGWSGHTGDAEDDDEDGEKLKQEVGQEEEGEEEESEEDDEEADILGDEPLASEGMAGALALAQRRAYIQTPSSSSFSSTAALSSGPTASLNLAQYDALGRELSQREKFRLLSHAFHGQGAGINKRDKRVRSLKREVGVLKKVRQKEGMDGGMDKVLEAQRRLGQAYLVLDGGNTAPAGGALAPHSRGASSSRPAGTESESRKRVKR